MSTPTHITNTTAVIGTTHSGDDVHLPLHTPDGRGLVTLVTGGPGTGKSRMLDLLRQQLGKTAAAATSTADLTEDTVVLLVDDCRRVCTKHPTDSIRQILDYASRGLSVVAATEGEPPPAMRRVFDHRIQFRTNQRADHLPIDPGKLALRQDALLISSETDVVRFTVTTV